MLGFSRTRDASARYDLHCEGSGRLIPLKSDLKVTDSASAYEVIDEMFLKTPDGVYSILSETPKEWLVDGDDGPINILKPSSTDYSGRYDQKPIYSVTKYFKSNSETIQSPPYSSMNKALWLRAIDHVVAEGKSSFNAIQVLKYYNRLKGK